MGECQELAARLTAIRRNDRPTAERSQSRLFAEYLRRGSLWALEFGLGEMLFLDIAFMVNPGVRAPSALIDQAVSAIGPYASYYERRAVEQALHFAALKDSGESMPDLPDPFLPLLRLLERGGSFTRDCSGAFIDLGGISVPKRNARKWAAVAPLTAFDDASLDRMDAAWREARVS